MEPNKFAEIIKTIIKEELAELHLHLKSVNNEEYLTRKQAAIFLHISVTTLWDYDKNQILPARRIGGKVLYLKSDLLNFSTPAA
jgi:hypothetical protein